MIDEVVQAFLCCTAGGGAGLMFNTAGPWVTTGFSFSEEDWMNAHDPGPPAFRCLYEV